MTNWRARLSRRRSQIVGGSALAAAALGVASSAAWGVRGGTPLPPQQPSRMSPESVFTRFLDLSVATRQPRPGRLDSVYTAGMQFNYDSNYAYTRCEQSTDARWMADYRVLRVVTTGDSAVASVELVTVAHETEHGVVGVDAGVYHEATLRLKTDTGHWELLRSARETGGVWKVCGDAREGFSLFPAGRVGAVRWLPPGASADKARAAIDSIRKSRGLPIIR